MRNTLLIVSKIVVCVVVFVLGVSFISASKTTGRYKLLFQTRYRINKTDSIIEKPMSSRVIINQDILNIDNYQRQ